MAVNVWSDFPLKSQWNVLTYLSDTERQGNNEQHIKLEYLDLAFQVKLLHLLITFMWTRFL